MTLFLTSSPCVIGAPRVILNPANGFVDRLRDSLPRWPRLLIVASDPDDHGNTCHFGNEMVYTLREYGMPCGSFNVLDGSNGEDASILVNTSDLIVLMGGHVPTQNAFFHKIRLSELLRDYSGVVLGISAGSMNMAETVYAQPEEPGESGPDYERFIPGLGITDINILPHHQKVRHYTVDGLRLFEDITFPDSMGRCFFALPDGSYIYQDETQQLLCGKGYSVMDGVMEQINDDEEVLDLNEV